jgi:group I intron endonuclease
MNKLKIYSGIYQYKFKQCSKVYIGSSLNLRKRNTQHLSALYNNSHDNKDFQQAYNKYGLDNLLYSVLKYIEDDDVVALDNRLRVEEQLYLDFYGAKDYIDSGDLSFFTKTFNKSAVATGTISKCNKRVYQFSKNGVLINTYCNSNYAEYSTNIDCSSIRRVCCGQRKSAGGYYWRFTPIFKDSPVYKDQRKKLYQYDINKNLINEFKSIADAREKTGIKIRKGKKGKISLMNGGYYWLFDGEEFPIYKKQKLPKSLITDCEDFVSKDRKYGDRKKFTESMSYKYAIDESKINSLLNRLISKQLLLNQN